MSKVDPTVCKKTSKGEWSNLPHDLLSRIADELGLIEFLTFRGVSEDWHNAATLKALRGDNKSFGCDPWFLLYGGEGSQCSLLSKDNKVYTTDIPELDGATCLASYEGWLLVFRGGSLFFFCPFSKAKIELPNCPFTKLTNHIAAFSSAPTSHDCIVVVINCYSDYELELHMLGRGDNIWDKHRHTCFTITKTAVFMDGLFIFWDAIIQPVTFDAATRLWKSFDYRTLPSVMSVNDELHKREIFRTNQVRRELGLDADALISTCGTMHPHTSGKYHIVIQSATVFENAHLKGVWVLPRYHIVPPNQSWQLVEVSPLYLVLVFLTLSWIYLFPT